MSKIFKSAFVKERTVSIKSNDNIGIHIAIAHGDDTSLSTSLRRSDAPAIALAIIEASGITPAHSDSWTAGEPDNLARIAADLQHHIERRDARTQEAADREALEDEAAQFLSLIYPSGAAGSVRPFSGYSTDAQNLGIEYALKAREIHGGTK